MMTMHGLVLRITRLAALSLGVFVFCAARADGSEIRFFPIRSAPQGSPVGTVGDPISPVFNTTLGCWEYTVDTGGIEVDIDIQGGGWGNALGSPNLGAIQTTVDASGYSNGVGADDLSPKGWPGSPSDGAYQADRICGAGGDGSPCVVPFNTSCTGNGFCIGNPDFIFRPFMNASYLAVIATPGLNYGYAVVAQNVNNTGDPDPSSFGTFGSLIVNVPANAAGTYEIAPKPDPNSSFMTAASGAPIPGVVFTPACITVPCQADDACNDNLDCTTNQCNLVTSLCEFVVLPDLRVIDGQCIILGDLNGDQVVTLADYLHWQDCETGPIDGPYMAGCEIFDFEPNDLVDLHDFARFQRAFEGP